MPDFIFQMSDMTIFISMVVLTILVSLLLVVLNKVFIFYTLRYKDNTTTASVSSLIGIVYGVLAGLICLYLLNNQDHASNAALEEGIAAGNVYRESRWLKGPMQHEIQATLKTYIQNVITIEWPQMKSGKVTEKADGNLITKMSDQLIHYPMTSQADALAINNLMLEIKALYHDRQQRIEMSKAQLSPELWEVILISTILIIVINYAFRVNFYLHVFSISTFAIMAAAVLFLLVTLDRPFQGEFLIAPDALQSVLDSMQYDEVKSTASSH